MIDRVPRQFASREHNALALLARLAAQFQQRHLAPALSLQSTSDVLAGCCNSHAYDQPLPRSEIATSAPLRISDF